MNDTNNTPDAVREAKALEIARDLMVKHFGPGKSSATPAAWVIEAMLTFAALDSRAGDAGEGLVLPPGWKPWTGGPFTPQDYAGRYMLRNRSFHDWRPGNGAGPSWKWEYGEGDVVAYLATPAPAVDAVPAGEVWRDIDEAARNGKYQWVGRSGDFPFADWLRWDGARWLFSDGAHMTEGYGKLIYHPLPAPPTDAAPECLCCGGSRQERYVGYGNSEEIRDCSVCGSKAALSHGEGRK